MADTRFTDYLLSSVLGLTYTSSLTNCVLWTKFVTPSYSCWLPKKTKRHHQADCALPLSVKIKAVKTTRSSTDKSGFLATVFKTIQRIRVDRYKRFENAPCGRDFLWKRKIKVASSSKRKLIHVHGWALSPDSDSRSRDIISLKQLIL